MSKWLNHLPSQELGQARPAEEIWLDALITVLEEALDAGATRGHELTIGW